VQVQNTAFRSAWLTSFFLMMAEVKPPSCSELATVEKMISIPTIP
jgi:hypothetical protein